MGKIATKVAVFTGSDLRSFGGGEKDIVGWANKVSGLKLTIYSFSDKSNTRMTYEGIRQLFKPDVNIVYYSAYKAEYLRDIIPLTKSGIRALWSLRKFDTVYSMHQGLLLNGLIILLCKIFNIKYIFGVHSPIFFDDQPIEDQFFKKILFRFFTAYRDFLVRNMRYVRIQNKSDERNILKRRFRGMIYNIPPHVFEDSLTVEAESNCSEFIALFVGRLSIRHKGLDFLEKVIDKVMESSKSITFHVIGSGSEGEPIMERLTSKYPENFHWRGFLSEEDLEKEYRNASLFLFPSRGENFGISLGEAQVHGLPAVAFKVMGAEDIMTNEIQGILVAPFDIDAFGNAALKYFRIWAEDPSGYTDLKRSIARLVRNEFSDDKMTASLEEMLKNRDVRVS